MSQQSKVIESVPLTDLEKSKKKAHPAELTSAVFGSEDPDAGLEARQNIQHLSKYLSGAIDRKATGSIHKDNTITITRGPNTIWDERGINSVQGRKERDDIEHTSSPTSFSFIEPPIDLELLTALGLLSHHLKVALDALVTGIYATDYEIIPRPELEQTEIDNSKPKIQAEIRKAKTFLETMDIEGSTHKEMKVKIGWNTELTGNAYIEVVRKKESDGTLGEPYAVQILDSVDMRLGDLSNGYYNSIRKFFDGQEWVDVAQPKRRRIFVQLTHTDGRYTYFKEMGDIRRVSADTGAEITDEEWNQMDDPQKEKTRLSNEIHHIKLYYPGTPYGIPRYIGTLYSILGSIYKEENDIGWFLRGCKADLVISSPYPLAASSIEDIKNYVKQASQLTNSRKALVLIPNNPVNDPLMDDNPRPANVKVEEIGQQRDAQFVKLDQENRENIKASLRLADLHVGRNKDFNRATAEVAQENTEDNVFAPGRTLVDDFFNNVIFPELGLQYVYYKSKTRSRINKEIAAKLITTLNKGMTIRDLRTMAEQLLDRPLPNIEKSMEEAFKDKIPNILDIPISILESVMKNSVNQILSDALLEQSLPNTVNPPVADSTIKEVTEDENRPPSDETKPEDSDGSSNQN